jgi:hypothetical protein
LEASFLKRTNHGSSTQLKDTLMAVTIKNAQTPNKQDFVKADGFFNINVKTGVNKETGELITKQLGGIPAHLKKALHANLAKYIETNGGSTVTLTITYNPISDETEEAEHDFS